MKSSFSQRLPARYTQALVDMLESDYGVAPAKLARAQALCAPLAELPEGFISLDQFAEICEIALDACGDPWLGFRFGRRLSPISHGVMGAAASSSSRVADIVALSTKFADMFFPASFDFEQKGSRFSVSYCFPPRIDKNREFHSQVTLAGSLKLMEDSTGYLPRDILIHLPFAESEGYREQLPHSLVFNSSSLSIEYPASYLQAPLLSADPATHALYVTACENLARQLKESRSLAASIRQLLEGCERHYPSLEQVADMLKVSSRTLRNRLSRENLSYRELISQYRIETAKQMLMDDSATVASIADKLGYRDTANFSRAFKRDAGLSPTDYRTQKGHCGRPL